MPIDQLFEMSDTEKKEEIKPIINDNKKVFIPDTCDDYNIEILQDVNQSDIEAEELVIKDTIEMMPFKNNGKCMVEVARLKLNEHSTPKAVKKLLNEHGLSDMTNSPTFIDLNNDSVRKIKNKDKKKTSEGDKFDNLLDNIFNKNDSSAEKPLGKANNITDDDSLNFSLDFKKTSTLKPQSDFKKHKSNDSEHQTPSCKSRLRQMTMTQVFENVRASQFKENLAINTSNLKTNASKPSIKPNNKLITENRDIQQTKRDKPTVDDDDDLFLLETIIDKKQSLANASKSKNDFDMDGLKSDDNKNGIKKENYKEEEEDEDEDDDELIFNFDKVPKSKTNSPNYKYVQVIKKQNERKKLTTSSCRECETVSFTS